MSEPSKHAKATARSLAYALNLTGENTMALEIQSAIDAATAELRAENEALKSDLEDYKHEHDAMEKLIQREGDHSLILAAERLVAENEALKMERDALKSEASRLRNYLAPKLKLIQDLETQRDKLAEEVTQWQESYNGLRHKLETSELEYEDALRGAQSGNERADRAEAALKEADLLYVKLLKEADTKTATAEAAAAQMREALEGYATCCDGCTCGDGWSHESALKALATDAGCGWVPIRDVKPLLEELQPYGGNEIVEDFLAKHGDKLK